MAKLLSKPFVPPVYDMCAADWKEQYAAAWKAVQAEGDLLQFPVADGAAIYIVRSISPPVLQWVAIGDRWQADPALIRGLRSVDIEERIERAKKLKALFSE